MPLVRPPTWFIAMVILGIATITVSGTSGAADVQGVTQLAVSPVQGSLHAILAPITDLVTNIGSYADLRDENQHLQADNDRLRTQMAQLQEATIQSKELSSLVQFQAQQPSQHFQAASIVAHDPSNLHDRIEIDRGSNDGIHAGMAVLGGSGALVGTVRETLPNRAWVALLSDSQSNINAVVQENRALAILQGSVGKRVSLQLVAQSVDLKIGNTVLTSGLGGNYPAGLVIGRVSAIQGQPQDLFKNVSVEPVERLDNLEHVLVLTSFTPSQG